MKTQVLLLFLQSFRLEDLLLLRRQNTVVMRLQLLSSLWVAVVSSVVFFSITQCLLLLLAATLPVLGTPRARPLRPADTIQQILKDLIPFTPETKVVLRNAFLFSPNRTVPRAQEIAVGAVAAYSLSRSCPNLRATELHKKAFQESIKTRVSEDSIILRWPDFEQASWLLDHVQRKQRERTHYASPRKVIERCWGNYISNAVVIEDTVAQDSVRISDSAQLGHELRKLSLPSKWMSRTSREDTMDFVIATVHQWLQMYRKACLQSDPNSDAQIHANIDAQILLGLLLHAVAAQTFTDPLLVFLFLDAPTSEAFGVRGRQFQVPQRANVIQAMIINRHFRVNDQNDYRRPSIAVSAFALACVTLGTHLTREKAQYFLLCQKNKDLRDQHISQKFKKARTDAAQRFHTRYLKDSGHEDWKDFLWASLSSGYPAMACVTQAVECLYSQRLKTYLSSSAVSDDIRQAKHEVVEQIVSQTQLALARLSEPHLTQDEQVTLTYFFALILRDLKRNKISNVLASFELQQCSAPNPQVRDTPEDVTGDNASSSLVACGSSSSSQVTVDHHTGGLEPSSASVARAPPDTAINTFGIETLSGLTIKQTNVVLRTAVVLCCYATVENAHTFAADATVVSDIFSRSPNISLRSLREKFADQLATRHRSGSPPRLHQILRNWLMPANIALAQVQPEAATTDQKALENYLYDYILPASRNTVVDNAAAPRNVVVLVAAALVTDQNIDSTQLKRKPEVVFESLCKVLSKLNLPQKWIGKGHLEDMIQFVTETVYYRLQTYQEYFWNKGWTNVDVQLFFALLLHSASTSTFTDQLLEFLLGPDNSNVSVLSTQTSKRILEVMIANRIYPSIDWSDRRHSPLIVYSQAVSIPTDNADTNEMYLKLRSKLTTVERCQIQDLKLGASATWKELLFFFLSSGYPALQFVTKVVELYYCRELKRRLMQLEIAEAVAEQIVSDTQLALEKLSELYLTDEEEGALSFFFGLLFRDLEGAKVSEDLQIFWRQEGLPYWQLQGTAQEPGGENEGSFLAITRGTPAVDDASGPLQSASPLAATSAADENRSPIISGNGSSDHTSHPPSASNTRTTDSGSQLQPPSLPSDASVTDPSQDSSVNDKPYNPSVSGFLSGDTDSLHGLDSGARQQDAHLLGGLQSSSPVPGLLVEENSSPMISGNRRSHRPNQLPSASNTRTTDSGSQLIGDHDGSGPLQPSSLPSDASVTDPSQDSSFSIRGFLLRNGMPDDEYTTPGGAAALQMADTDSAFPKGSDALNVGKVPLRSEDTWKEIRPDIVPTMATVSDTPYNPSASSSVLSGDTNLHHWLDDGARQQYMHLGSSSVFDADPSYWLNFDGNSIYHSSSSGRPSAMPSATANKRCNSTPQGEVPKKKLTTEGGGGDPSGSAQMASAFPVKTVQATSAEMGLGINSESDVFQMHSPHWTAGVALEVSHSQSGTSTDPELSFVSP